MIDPDIQSEFSIAYIRAVAHAGGFFVQETPRTFDADGIDLTIMKRGAAGTVRSPQLNLQVKSKALKTIPDPFPYDLPIKNYDELRDSRWQTPRLLVVVVVPANQDHWVKHSEKELLLRRCGYWRSLVGQPAVTNKKQIRVDMPRVQVFDILQLQGIMANIEKGGMP